jgi:hypothetical protein
MSRHSNSVNGQERKSECRVKRVQFRVQALACLVTNQQPEGWTLNFRLSGWT